jgi:hypothetical protein
MREKKNWHISRRFVPPESADLVKAQELAERDGRGTIYEAMLILKEQAGEFFNIEKAVRNGEISSYAPGSCKPLGTPQRNLITGLEEEEVYGVELNAWLNANYPHVKFRFPEVGAAGTAKSKAGRKPGKQPERMKQILDALEKWAVSEGNSFDRQAMPGQVGKGPTDNGSFHWFCASLPQPFKTDFQKGARAFENYRAGLCVFPPWAKPSDFYRNALPHIAQSLQSVASNSVSPRKARKAR